jgi:hypothetical protein
MKVPNFIFTRIHFILIDSGQLGAELAEDRLLRGHDVSVKDGQWIIRNDPVFRVVEHSRKLDDFRTRILDSFVRPACRFEVDDDVEREWTAKIVLSKKLQLFKLNMLTIKVSIVKFQEE